MNGSNGCYRYLGLALLTLVSASSASAQFATDPVRLGNPSYGGNGCPAGSASAALSSDGTQLSLLFDQFIAEAGGVTGKSVDRKSCNVAIPVHVPHGLSVSVIKVDYRGFNSLPYGGSSTFNVEYFFAGSTGPKYSKRFSGPINTDYLIHNELIASSLVWSACGQDVILRTNSSMMVLTNSLQQQALSTVDSADISAGVLYQLQWRRCM